MAIIPVMSATEKTSLNAETDYIPFKAGGSTNDRFNPRSFVENFHAASLHFKFTTTTSGDPTSTKIGFDNSNPALVNNLRINNLSLESFGVQNILEDLEFGDLLFVKQQSDKVRAHLFSVNAPPIDNTGWFTIPVNPESTGTLPANDRNLEVGIVSLAGRSRHFQPPLQLTDDTPIHTDAFRTVNFDVTLDVAGATRQLDNPINIKVGDELTWNVVQDLGTEALTYDTFFEFPDKIAPVLSGTAGALDILSGKVRASGKITLLKINNVGV